MPRQKNQKDRQPRKRSTEAELKSFMIRFNLSRKEVVDFLNKFRDHQGRAADRGIPFLFTIDQWIKIWLDSGHWNERGIRKGQYCMARFGDVGPYSVDNVKIILHSENVSEGLIGNTNSVGVVPSKKTRKLISNSLIGNKRATGSKRSPKHKAAIGAASRGNIGRPNWRPRGWTKTQRLEAAEKTRKSWELRREKKKQEAK